MQHLTGVPFPVSKGRYAIKFTMTAGTAVIETKQANQSDEDDTTFDPVPDSSRSAADQFEMSFSPGMALATLTGDAAFFIMKIQ